MSSGPEFAAALGRVARRWRTELNARVKHLGLTQARWLTLLRLRRVGPLSQTDLADQIGVEGPTLVRLLDALEAKDLIRRCESEADRRVKIVHLSPSAMPLIDRIAAMADQLSHELTDGIPAEDLAAAARVLHEIGNRLERS